MKINTTGMKGFLLWLKSAQPRVYNEYTRRMHAQLAGFGDTTSEIGDPAVLATAAPAPASWVTNIRDILLGASQVYLAKTQLDTQKKVLDMQLQRAQQGLAPLDINPATYGLQPTVGVGVSNDTKQLLIWGGVGLAAVYLLPKLFGR